MLDFDLLASLAKDTKAADKMNELRRIPAKLAEIRLILRAKAGL